MTTFGNNLKYYRKKSGLNQSQLGKKIGVGQTSVANYEKGIRVPSIQLIETIKSVLGVSVDDLLLDRSRTHTLDSVNKASLVKVLEDILLKKSEADPTELIASLKPNAHNFADILDQVISPVMYKIGRLWMEGTVSVAEEHAATETVVSLLNWMSAQVKPLPYKGVKVVSMAYTTEFHTLGMSMVSVFLKVRGYSSLYLGNNLPTDYLIDYLKKEQPDMLLLSVTMISQLNGVRNMIDAIRKVPQLDHMTIVVGGQGTVDVSFENQTVFSYQGNLNGLERWIDHLTDKNDLI